MMNLTGYPTDAYSADFFQAQIDSGRSIESGNYLIKDSAIFLNKGVNVQAKEPGKVRLYVERGHGIIAGFNPIAVDASVWPSTGGINLKGLRLYFPGSYYSFPNGSWNVGNKHIRIICEFPGGPAQNEAVFGICSTVDWPAPIAMQCANGGVHLMIGSADGSITQLWAKCDLSTRRDIIVHLEKGVVTITIDGLVGVTGSYKEPLLENLNSHFCIGSWIQQFASTADSRVVGNGMILHSFEMDNQILDLPKPGSPIAGQGGFLIDPSKEYANYPNGQIHIEGLIVEGASPFCYPIGVGMTQQSMKIENCSIGGGALNVGSMGYGPCYMLHLNRLDTFYGTMGSLSVMYGIVRYNDIRMNFPGFYPVFIDGATFTGSGLYIAPGGGEGRIQAILRSKALEVNQIINLEDCIVDFEGASGGQADIMCDISRQTNKTIVNVQRCIFGGGGESGPAVILTGKKDGPVAGIFRIKDVLSQRAKPTVQSEPTWIVEGAING